MKRNKFSLSHTRLLSCRMGQLVPIGLMEVLPGDSFQQTTSLLLRCSPLLAPVMHPVDVRIHHWFVPHRLTWKYADEVLETTSDTAWEDFITGGADGNNVFPFPTIDFSMAPVAAGELANYLGCPIGTDIEVSALPFRAYDLIWNEWYRDQDLEDKVAMFPSDGPDTLTSTALLNCAWEKDYFTSARPFEQKGPAITVPIGTTAPIKGTNIDTQVFNEADATLKTLRVDAGGTVVTSSAPTGAGDLRFAADTTKVGLEADLTGASAVTVNALREALALQRYEENRARYGSRYVEYLRYLGVRSSDARLQRPEYLGGGRQTIQFSEVLATAETGTAVDVGDMKGHGIAAARSNRYRKFFEEHGYVLTLMSVRPKTIYMNGLFRTWNRRFKEDFWQQELQHIGQQPVAYKEVYVNHATPDGTFGWQDRYDDYRRMESFVAGEFATSTLDEWHFARQFATDPSLNDEFVSCVPTEVPFASSVSDTLYVCAKHSVQTRRLVAETGNSFIY